MLEECGCGGFNRIEALQLHENEQIHQMHQLLGHLCQDVGDTVQDHTKCIVGRPWWPGDYRMVSRLPEEKENNMTY